MWIRSSCNGVGNVGSDRRVVSNPPPVQRYLLLEAGPYFTHLAAAGLGPRYNVALGGQIVQYTTNRCHCLSFPGAQLTRDTDLIIIIAPVSLEMLEPGRKVIGQTTGRMPVEINRIRFEREPALLQGLFQGMGSNRFISEIVGSRVKYRIQSMLIQRALRHMCIKSRPAIGMLSITRIAKYKRANATGVKFLTTFAKRPNHTY